VTGEVVLLIVAAGAGRRLGGAAKALLRDPVSGASFLARIAATGARAGAGRALVVVGPPHGTAVADEAARLGARVAANPDPDRGMASSVAIGFEQAMQEFGAACSALLWPVDHARVADETAARLVREAAAGAADRILVPTWQGRGGHPTAFGRALWPELAACAGLPRGARSVLEQRADRVVRIAVDDPGVTADVDEPGDLD
jgi:CTP:molybdopterin cytidylyltransferase MocA